MRTTPGETTANAPCISRAYSDTASETDEAFAAAGTTLLCLPLARGELKRGRRPHIEHTTNSARNGAASGLLELWRRMQK
jgi:hypothetical protein